MNKKYQIDRIYEILIQYEQLIDGYLKITEETYRNYIDRLATWYLGKGQEEIEGYLRGLYQLGANAKHDTVKRIVFHIIHLLDDREV